MRLTTIENCKILHWFNSSSFFFAHFFSLVYTTTSSPLVLEKAWRTHGQCPKSIPLYHHNWVSSLKIQIISSHCPIHLCVMSKAMAIAHQITSIFLIIKDTQNTRLKNIYIKVNHLICAAIWVKHKHTDIRRGQRLDMATIWVDASSACMCAPKVFIHKEPSYTTGERWWVNLL